MIKSIKIIDSIISDVWGSSIMGLWWILLSKLGFSSLSVVRTRSYIDDDDVDEDDDDDSFFFSHCADPR